MNANLDGLTVQVNAITKANALSDVSGLAIHIDFALGNPGLNISTRANTALRQHLLQFGTVNIRRQNSLFLLRLRLGNWHLIAFGEQGLQTLLNGRRGRFVLKHQARLAHPVGIIAVCGCLTGLGHIGRGLD